MLCETVARHSSLPQPRGVLSWSPAVEASDNKTKPSKQKGQRWWSSNPAVAISEGFLEQFPPQFPPFMSQIINHLLSQGINPEEDSFEIRVGSQTSFSDFCQVNSCQLFVSVNGERYDHKFVFFFLGVY